MDTSLLSAKRRQEYEGFRHDLTAKLRADLVALTAVIQRRLCEHSSDPGDAAVSGYLDEFVSRFAGSLDVEFDRLFDRLSTSKCEVPLATGGSAVRSISPDLALGDTHTADHAASEAQSPQTTAAPHDTTSRASHSPRPSPILLGKLEGPDNPGSRPVTPPQTPPTAGKLEYSLTVDEIGPALVPTLAKWVADGGFTGKVRVLDMQPVDWSSLRRRVERPKGHDLLGIEYAVGKVDGQFSRLGLARAARFRFPDLSRPINKPSQADIREYLQKLTTNKQPRGPIPYYVGPSLTQDFDTYLHSGPDLSRLSVIPGVNTPYWHAGNKGSGTAFHCEDANFRSCNITMFGWKLWIIIDEKHTGKFEAFIRRCWGGNVCDQFVRHHSLLISPERLSAEGIDVEVFCAGPGDMVITAPRQYHAVVNITPCFAISTNFLLPDEPIFSGTLTVCPECGLHSLDSEVLEKISCASTMDVSEPDLKHIRSIARDDSPVTGSVLDASAEGRKRRIEFEVLTPPKRQRTDASLKDMADQLIDECSMRRFMRHVAAAREQRSLMKGIELDGTANWDEQAARLYTFGTSLDDSSEFNQLLSVMAATQAANIIDSTASQFGYAKAPTNMVEQILQRLGQNTNSANRKKLQDWLKVSRKMAKVLGPLRGLLLFLPFKGGDLSSVNEYLQLAESDIKKFQPILKEEASTTALAHMGRLLEESILTGKIFPEPIWQGVDSGQLQQLGSRRLGQLLGTYEAIDRADDE